jgi:hypothetical protein
MDDAVARARRLIGYFGYRTFRRLESASQMARTQSRVTWKDRAKWMGRPTVPAEGAGYAAKAPGHISNRVRADKKPPKNLKWLCFGAAGLGQ